MIQIPRLLTSVLVLFAVTVQALVQQQSFQLSEDVLEQLPSARIWSLSTAESHQQAFPPAAHKNDTAQPSSSLFPEAVSGELQWSLSNTNRSIQIPALFPSLAHLDLLRSSIIDDPSIGLNERTSRGIIDEAHWTYTADLSPIVPHLSSSSRQTWLYFGGLDTVTSIYIGSELVGETQNQHMWHAFPIPTQLREGKERNVTLVFHNTNNYAAEQAKKYGPKYPNQIKSPKRSRTSDYEYPNRIFVRKQQSDFGWDWGPALVPVGPHKEAYLIAMEEDGGVVVLESAVDIYRKGQVPNLSPPDEGANWVVNVSLTLLSPKEVEWAALRLSIPSLGWYSFDQYLTPSVLKSGLNEAWAAFEVPSSGKYGPELWWPRGYGEQKLYEIVLRSDELGLTVHKKVGFRTAVFDLSPITPEEVKQGVQSGSNFRLLLDGVEIYVIGTNIIPFDTLSPRTSPEYLRWVVESAAQAGVNLIRIWGGGSYPTEELLSLCDDMGIMVWVDTMFAASLYPYHPSFLEEVRREVGQIMPPILSHPSVVVVVGNNEGELYFLGGYGRREEDQEWKKGYEALFDHVVRDTVLGVSRGVSYIPCSTTTGYLTLEPYVGRYDKYGKGELHGTGEHYGYNPLEAFNIDTYPRSRFMVEFGMFSLPSLPTIERILPDNSSYSVNSTILRAHLKHPPAGNLTYPFPADHGQSELLHPITLYFPDPSLSHLTPKEELGRWSYSSQLYQSLYVSNQIAVYRKQAGGRERNRGIIVWQLNDVWEGTSWSSVEYGGRWKIAHYGLAKVQRPVVAVGVYNSTEDSLEINMLYSGAQKGGAVRLSMEWFDFGGRPLEPGREALAPIPKGVIGASEVPMIERPTKTICGGEGGCYLRITVLDHTETITYWTPMTKLKQTLAKVAGEGRRPKLNLRRKGPWTVEVRNEGDAVAPYVWVEHGEGSVGYFRGEGGEPENAVWLNPGEGVVLTFVRPGGGDERESGDGKKEDEERWFRSLSVSSLFDNLPGS